MVVVGKEIASYRIHLWLTHLQIVTKAVSASRVERELRHSDGCFLLQRWAFQITKDGHDISHDEDQMFGCSKDEVV